MMSPDFYQTQSQAQQNTSELSEANHCRPGPQSSISLSIHELPLWSRLLVYQDRRHSRRKKFLESIRDRAYIFGFSHRSYSSKTRSKFNIASLLKLRGIKG